MEADRASSPTNPSRVDRAADGAADTLYAAAKGQFGPDHKPDHKWRPLVAMILIERIDVRARDGFGATSHYLGRCIGNTPLPTAYRTNSCNPAAPLENWGGWHLGRS
ncbi:hypothetical protein GCM10020219_073760 [Nonomuraea dietziae]